MITSYLLLNYNCIKEIVFQITIDFNSLKKVV